MQQNLNHGGGFAALQGVELEQEVKKNAWLRAHNLPYEDEVYPLSPSLLLKESTAVLLSIPGILILLLFFGTTLTAEKEQHTLLTLKTQPITKRKLIVGKYLSLLFIIGVFLAAVIGIGLIIPSIFGNQTMNLLYPQILSSNNSFTVISTVHYLVRVAVLFICVSAFVFSLILLVSTQVKNSFSALVVTSFICMVGFVVTNMNVSLQSALNPFQYFHFQQLLAEVPLRTDWIYPVAAFIWSSLFVALASFLPEKETGLFLSSENKNPFRDGKTKKHLSTVWNNSIFEWRKIKRKGILKQLYLILFLLIALWYFAISQQVQQKETLYMDELQSKAQSFENELIPFVEEGLISLEEKKQIAEETGDNAEYSLNSHLIDRIEQTIELFHEIIAKIKVAITAYEQQDWLPFYEYQLHQNRLANGEFNRGNYHDSRTNIFGNFTMDVSIAEKNWQMERNIQPVFSGEFVSTIYSNWGDRVKEKKKWEEENRKVDNSGLFSLYLFFENYVYFVLIILFLFLLGSGFASEKGKKNTLHFLKTQPIAEKNIFVGKVINAAMVALLSCLGIFVFVVLIGTAFNRFGDWYYPILHYDSTSLTKLPTYTGIKSVPGGFHFIPIGDYLVKSIVLFLFVILFIIVLSILLSLFFQRQFGVFVTVILIGAIGYVGSSQMLSEKAHLSPFTYLNITKITNVEVATLVDNPSITVQTGSLVLLASTLILFVIGYILLSWKNERRRVNDEKFRGA